MNTLVVDDFASIRKITSVLLRQQRHTVEVAEDGLIAPRSLLKDDPFNIQKQFSPGPHTLEPSIITPHTTAKNNNTQQGNVYGWY